MTAEQDRKRLNQTFKYRLKRWRRNNRDRLNRALTRHYGTPEPHPARLPEPPQRILVCRLNSRLGNMLFLTPLLTSLAATFPAARIDVLINDAVNAPLLQGLPGVATVLALPDQPGLHLWAVLKLIRHLRRQQYDLVIDPVLDSVSNRFGVLLAGGRMRLGFAGDNQWLRLDAAAPRPADEPHQARQALRLLRDGLLDVDIVYKPYLSASLSKQARMAGEQHYRAAFGNHSPNGPVVGFFANATGAKQLPRQWWQAWYTHLTGCDNPPTVLQLLPPGETSTLAPDLPWLRIDALDELAAALSHLDLFVCADGGPMHLATAAGVPVIGLFRATDPHTYAPLGRACSTIAGDDLTAETVVARVRHQLASPAQ